MGYDHIYDIKILDENPHLTTEEGDISDKQYGPEISTETRVHQSDVTSSTNIRLDQPLFQIQIFPDEGYRRKSSRNRKPPQW